MSKQVPNLDDEGGVGSVVKRKLRENKTGLYVIAALVVIGLVVFL